MLHLPPPLKQTASCKFGLIPWSVFPLLPLWTKRGSDNILSQPAHLILVDETRDFDFVPRGTLLTLEKGTLLVLLEIHMAPQTSLSIPAPAPLHDLQCFLQPFHLCCGSWFQISSGLLAFSKMEFAFLFFILLVALECFQRQEGENIKHTLLLTIWKFSVGVTCYHTQEYCHLMIFKAIKCIFSLKYAVYMLVIRNLILKSLWLTQGLRAS